MGGRLGTGAGAWFVAVIVSVTLGGCGGSKGSTSAKTATQLVKTSTTLTTGTSPAHMTGDQALAVLHAQKAIVTAASACLNGRMTLSQKTAAANATNLLMEMYDQLGPAASSQDTGEPIVMRAALSGAAVDMKRCTALKAQDQELHSALFSGR